MSLRAVMTTLGLTILLVGCDDPTTHGNVGLARVAVTAVAPPSLARFAPGLVIERLRATVERPIPAQETSEVLAQKTVPFDINRNRVDLSFSILIGAPETLFVKLQYETLDSTVLFVASSQVIVQPGRPAGPPPALQPFYVGPGSNITFMSITPFDSVLSAADSLTFQVLPLDANQQPVTSFYVSWTTDDPQIPINALGRLGTANVTKLLNITARTPNGVVASTTLTLQGTAAFGIDPDSVEKLPGGTQLFRVAVGLGRTTSLIWSVNGIDGGDSQFGTINVDGTYTGPAAVPSPSKFKVCARDAQDATRQGCAIVVIRAVPSTVRAPGSDFEPR
jgi:hypothetical protein